jgi:hypothetical protein
MSLLYREKINDLSLRSHFCLYAQYSLGVLPVWALKIRKKVF